MQNGQCCKPAENQSEIAEQNGQCCKPAENQSNPCCKSDTPETEPKRKPKRFTGASNSSKSLTKKSQKIITQIPNSLYENKELQLAIQNLPKNYNFEIYKSIHQITNNSPKKVALQFPEGLLMYSLTISDILQTFCNVEVLVMGDVTYGACCIDDFTAIKLGCDFMIHYGHSCLIPVDITRIKTLYVFVDIGFDTQHFIDTVLKNVDISRKISLVATIQFVGSLQLCTDGLPGYDIQVPQSRPLSKGEILGCTAPKLLGRDLLLYLGDGRFHLEAIMIANPGIEALRYDPYSKKITREEYYHEEMYKLRNDAIEVAKYAKRIGLIQGTLGRQGAPNVTKYLEDKMTELGIEFFKILLPEIMPDKLGLFEDVDCWIQVACPRLSIDWGYAFPKPLLTPYEAAVVFGQVEKWDVKKGDGSYPMDFYAKDSLGEWTPNHQPPKAPKISK